VRVVGATLWSDVPPESQEVIGKAMNDYNMCYMRDTPENAKKTRRKMDFNLPPYLRRLLPSDTTAFHKLDLAFITAEVKAATEAKQKCVVLTHHAPQRKRTSAPEYDDHYLQPAFSTDLVQFFHHAQHPHAASVHTWCFGHTHYCVDEQIGDVRLVANQRGYEPKEVDLKYKPDLVITVT